MKLEKILQENFSKKNKKPKEKKPRDSFRENKTERILSVLSEKTERNASRTKTV